MTTSRLHDTQNAGLPQEHEISTDSLVRLRDTLRKQLCTLSDRKHAEAVARQIQRINREIVLLGGSDD